VEEKKPVSMEALFEKKASNQMVSEGNQFKTVARGVYTLRATKFEATEDPTQVNATGEPRTNINFSVDICDDEGNRKAKAFVRVSPDEGRTKNGYLDGKSKLYAQLSKALGLGLTDEQPSAGEVIQTFMQTPVKGFVGLQFKSTTKDPITGKAIYVDPKTDAEEADCRKKGYTPQNSVLSIQKA